MRTCEMLSDGLAYITTRAEVQKNTMSSWRPMLEGKEDNEKQKRQKTKKANG